MSTATLDAPETPRTPENPGPQRGRRRVDLTSPTTYFVALIVIALTMAPIVFIVLGGFRSNGQLNRHPFGLPDPWLPSNYIDNLGSAKFWNEFVNSLIVASVTTVGVLTFGLMASYVLARYRFRGRGVMFALFAAGLMFPITAAVTPLYLLLRDLHLLYSLFGVILPQIAFALPTTIIILVPFLQAIPDEIEEAAAMDGCSRLGFFFRMVVPLSLPGLLTTGILAFVASWNAFLLPLYVLSNDNMTLPLGVQQFNSEHSSETALILAFTSLAMIPALVVFTLFERRIVGGLQGAVKG